MEFKRPENEFLFKHGNTKPGVVDLYRIIITAVTLNYVFRFILLFLFLLLTKSLIYCQTQNYQLNTIPLKGDFSNFTGLCFLQDRDGFIWFGSTEGLYRYQGNSVKVFRHEPDNENSLSDNYVYDLFEDSDGMIWIGTRNGLNRFDKFTESFLSFTHDRSDTTSIVGGAIQKIAADANQNLWIATLNGFSMYNKETGVFKNYWITRSDAEAIKGAYQIFSLYPDTEELVWLNSDDGVYKLHVSTGELEKIKDIKDDFVWEVYKDISGRYWFSCFMGLYLYDEQNQSFNRFLLPTIYPADVAGQHTRSLVEDKDGNIWVRTFYGIFCYTQDLELIYSMEYPEKYEKNYRNQDMTKELLIDNSGNIWFYSPDAINQIIKGGNYYSLNDFGDVHNNTWVYCIYPESKDIIWYGTLNGISRLDRKTNDDQIFYGDTIWESGYLHKAYTMYPDQTGILWIGTETEGLMSLSNDKSGNRKLRKHIPESADSISLPEMGLYGIISIFDDKRGRLWLGCKVYPFLHYYDTLKNKVVRLVDNPSAKAKLPEWGFISHRTGKDTLWVINYSGFYNVILPVTEVSENTAIPADVIKCQLLNENGEKAEIPGVNDSYMDNSGIIWLASYNEGLVRLSKNNHSGIDQPSFTIKSYSIRDGLPGENVLSIQPDRKGNLWMGTNLGLSKFNIESETFTNYYVRHGLPANEFKAGSSATGTDGELFFGTIAGLISFYPDSVSVNQYIPPVRITGIRINNHTLKPGESELISKSVTYTDKLELSYNQNNISFEYAGLNYINPELNQYKYKLEGFNEDWIYAGNRTDIDFTNLHPGKYTLKVLASNNDGIWNIEGTSLGIIIHHPPWLKWYAWLAYLFILTVIIIWYLRFQRNRARLRLTIELEKMEKDKVLEIDRMKTRFFANISHEFRTPLTLIRGPLEDLDKQDTETILLKRELLDIMKRNTRRLQNLINQLLDISKMETGEVKLQVMEAKLEPFLRAIIQSFLSLAESKKIQYTYILPGSDQSHWYDSDKLEKILVNLISNAFKFTPEGGKVSISGKFINQNETDNPVYLVLAITDSGIGIPSDRLDRIFDRFYQVNDSASKDAEGTGIGLALTKELVDLYRGEISVKSMKGEGTTFTLKIPVDRNLFREDEQSVIPLSVEEPIVMNRSGEPETAAIITDDIVSEKGQPLILIVEDNPDLRTYISGNLSSNYTIRSGENGKNGFELACEIIPDLVISDLMMPVMDGMEMCRLLKEDQRTSHIPVIMLTAKADRDSKLEGLKTGADDYIIKPFDADELQVRVRNLIEQRQRLRETFRKNFTAEQNDIEAPFDDQLMQKLTALINNRLSDPELSIDHLKSELNMSRSQLFRKVHALTGYSPKELIRNIRLKKAAAYFRNGHKHVAHVMHEVGFNNQSYFSKCFREMYEVNPSEYIEKSAG